MDCDDSWYILRSSRFYTGFHSNLALEWSTSICLSKPLMQNLVETSVLTLDSRRIALGPPGMCLIISFQNVNFRKCRLISKSFDFWWWEWGRCPFRKTKSWKIRLLASALLSLEHEKSADPSRNLWARGWLKRVKFGIWKHKHRIRKSEKSDFWRGVIRAQMSKSDRYPSHWKGCMHFVPRYLAKLEPGMDSKGFIHGHKLWWIWEFLKLWWK